MMTETNQGEIESQSSRRYKRLGLTMLGIAGAVYGTEAVLLGAATVVASPATAVVSLALGAGLLYGSYKGFQRQSEMVSGGDRSSERRTSLSKVRKYLGGAALATAGVALVGLGLEAAAGAVIGFGVVAAGAVVTAWGIQKAREVFSPTVDRQGAIDTQATMVV